MRIFVAVCVAFFATAVLAQAVPETRRVTLLQMEISVPRTLPAATRQAALRTFSADTRRFRACGDAVRLAARYKAEKRFTGNVTTRTGVPMTALPMALRADLDSRPVGHASRVLTAPDHLRVVVACTPPTGPNRPIDRTI